MHEHNRRARKRQPLPMCFVVPLEGRFDFDVQESDHMAMLRERGFLA